MDDSGPAPAGGCSPPESTPRGARSTRRARWDVSVSGCYGNLLHTRLSRHGHRGVVRASLRRAGLEVSSLVGDPGSGRSRTGSRELRMRSHRGVIALVAAALAFAPDASAGNEGRRDEHGKEDRDQCRENDPGGDGPRILRADVDSSNLFIHGTGFGTKNGTVTLAGQRVGVASWSPTDIVAVLPSNLLPASYLLTVTPARGRCVKAGFDVAVGAGTQGPPGPVGPAGPAGPPGPVGATGPTAVSYTHLT